MSRKQPRTRFERLTSPLMRRVAMSVVVGGLATALVVVYIDRNGRDNRVVTVSAPVSTTVGTTPVAALNGTYDVIITAASAEYGATWPGPQLTPSVPITQQWLITCLRDTCAVKVTTGHVAEDPDGANLSTADNKTFSVSATTSASPDSPSLPPGCGAVNATDLQQLTLHATDAGARFAGTYDIHHPTIHVEGPITDGIGSCDSFSASLTITGVRH
jgi:hypothetical protein